MFGVSVNNLLLADTASVNNNPKSTTFMSVPTNCALQNSEKKALASGAGGKRKGKQRNSLKYQQ
jgi:hypothetical protein